MTGFSQKQIEVLEFSRDEIHNAIICDGSVRSGKSSVISISYILWAMANFKNRNFIIASQSVTAAERNIVKPLMQIVYLQQQFEIRYSIHTRSLIITRGNTTNYFYVFGGVNESSYETVQGITAAGAFLDEVVLMPESFVNQVLARCSVTGSKFWFSCNPESPNHWFYKEWIQKVSEKKVKYLHFTMGDNPSLSSDVISRYRSMYSGVFYDRYILGQWVRAEGIIYRKFADNKEDFILDVMPKDLILINVGVDFGGTKSATSFVAVGFTKAMKNIIVLESKRITKDLSPNLLDEEFTNFAEMVYNTYRIPFDSRCDNAEPVLIRGLKNIAMVKKLKTNVKNALKNPIKSRIDLLVRLMGEGRFFFMRNATSAINAFGESIWDAKKTDTRLDDGTIDMDTIDATEYAIEEFTNVLMDVSHLKGE